MTFPPRFITKSFLFFSSLSSEVSSTNMHVLLLPSVRHINATISKQCWEHWIHPSDEESFEVYNDDLFSDRDSEESQRWVAG